MVILCFEIFQLKVRILPKNNGDVRLPATIMQLRMILLQDRHNIHSKQNNE